MNSFYCTTTVYLYRVLPNMQYDLKITKWGFKSIYPMPSDELLESHYAEQYYQKNEGSYQKYYGLEELKYFEIESKVAEYLYKKYGSGSNKTMLDVGAGEGFFSKYFVEENWEVTMCDFSDYGMRQNNPQLVESLIKGNIYQTLSNLKSASNTYNFINLKNVIEHVKDPDGLLSIIKPLLSQGGILRIEVPNDYSMFQKFLLEKNFTKETWFCPPEHLHYFNIQSMTNFLIDLGFDICCMMTDFPIELFILNKHSNYAKERSLGKAAHMARVYANNYLYDQGIENYINYFKASANVEIGRQITTYVKVK